jgi:lipopolysaccharide assembly outer membrane protein LptD (OstA)
LRAPARAFAFLLTLYLGFLYQAEAQVDSTVGEFTSSLVKATPQLNQGGALQDKVSYKAKDSIAVSLDQNQARLYNEAVVDYQDINLKAGIINIHFKNQELTAKGLVDTAGKYVQRPLFTQDGQPYLADSIRYNFETKKAIIHGMVTNEGQSYVHGERIKKDDEDNLFIKYAGFTTCNKPTPHYQFYTTKAKIERGKRIYTGPALFEVGGVPTPVFVPFGFFPASQKRRSGVIIPTWGENRQQGFFLQNLGYYWAVNPKMDLTFLMDIYSFGGWAVRSKGRYKVAYKYEGNADITIRKTVLGDPLFDNGTNNFTSQDFQVLWNHRQNPKANPFTNFSASVDFVSPNFNQVNSNNPENFLTNTLKSTINYSFLFPGKPYQLNINASANQNLNTKFMDLRLPEVTFNLQRVNPFKRKRSVGANRWYEEIGVTYSGNFANSISDTIGNIFNPEDGFSSVAAKMRNGFRHAATANTNLRIWRFTLTPGVNATSRWYFSRLNYGVDTNDNITVVDSTRGLFQATDFSFTTSLATKIYGQFNYHRGWVKAIRHVMTPSINYALSPDFSDPRFGFFQEVFTTGSNGQDSLVGVGSRFNGYQYGNVRAGGLNQLGIRLDNTLEMKVNDPGSDEGTRKVKLLEGLSLNANYNAAAETFKWSTVGVTARTSLFKGNLSLLYTGIFDPYAVDSAGQRINEFNYRVGRRVLRNTSNTFQVGLRLRGKAKAKKDQPEETPSNEGGIQLAEEDINFYRIKQYAAFNVPWALNMDYNLRQTIQPDGSTVVTQGLGVTADLEITRNWRINVASGWDFEANDFTFTRFEIYRDLHCWQFSVMWVPTPGFQQGYSFNIGIRSSMLQDVKFNRQRRFGDF